MDFVLLLLAVFGTLFLGVPGLYYFYLWRVSSRPWALKFDKIYLPAVSILVPAFNEEKTIRLKLLNLSKVCYEKEKMQVIVVDDASSDDTVREVERFEREHPNFPLIVLRGEKRRGKAAGLNDALRVAKHDIIVVTDADTFWSRDILVEALPFFSDESIGALNGRQTLLEFERKLSTETEHFYLNLTYGVIKLGESKIHSTIIYHGLFSAYRRKFLNGFNVENDDSGTALDVVQNGGRTIFVPAAKCFEIPTSSWKAKVTIKVRRATQLLAIYARCLRLMLHRSLRLPFRIAIPEIFIYLVNPVLFVLFSSLLVFFLVTNLTYLVAASLILAVILLVPSKLRLVFLEAVQDNLLLFVALVSFLSRRKFSMWETQGESRSLLTEGLLSRYNLV